MFLGHCPEKTWHFSCHFQFCQVILPRVSEPEGVFHPLMMLLLCFLVMEGADFFFFFSMVFSGFQPSDCGFHQSQ